MKPEEAIKELESDKGLYESDIVWAGDGTPEGDLILALNMAIEALEKQTPKKPVKADEQVVRYVTTWNCPTCGGQFTGMVSNYCYHCGQALDWDNEAEQ